jgi:hypothetical protein
LMMAHVTAMAGLLRLPDERPPRAT